MPSQPCFARALQLLASSTALSQASHLLCASQLRAGLELTGVHGTSVHGHTLVQAHKVFKGAKRPLCLTLRDPEAMAPAATAPEPEPEVEAVLELDTVSEAGAESLPQPKIDAASSRFEANASNVELPAGERLDVDLDFAIGTKSVVYLSPGSLLCQAVLLAHVCLQAWLCAARKAQRRLADCVRRTWAR